MSDPSIKIVMRGDDAGSSQSANLAILHAHEHGNLRNAGIMAPCKHVDHAAEVFNTASSLCLGMHATFTSEWDTPRWGPVADIKQVPSLVMEDGFFPPDSNYFKEQGFELEHFAIELEAQLNRLRAAGLEVAYLDEHMGFNWLEGVGELLCDFARRYNLIYRPELIERGCYLPNPTAESLDAYVAACIQSFQTLTPGTYLILGHPVFDDPEIRQFQGQGMTGEQVALSRVNERELFCDSRILDHWKQQSMIALRYDEL